MNPEIISIDPASISTKKLHSILLTAVAPRPIAFASTTDLDGNVNLSPFSFFNVFSANPPILIFSPARRVRDNTIKHTLENVKATNEVVINIVNHAMVEQMSLTSTDYEKEVNEFDKAGFSEIPSELVTPPRVGEAPVAFECLVENIVALGNEGGAGNLVVCKVVKIHLNSAYVDAEGNLDTQKLDLVARLGGSWYTRVTKESLFEIPKPLLTKGIGVDKLPAHAKNSSILTGNNLGRLGNSEHLPTTTEIADLKHSETLQEILKIKEASMKEKELHLWVKNQLHKGDLKKALTALYCI